MSNNFIKIDDKFCCTKCHRILPSIVDEARLKQMEKIYKADDKPDEYQETINWYFESHKCKKATKRGLEKLEKVRNLGHQTYFENNRLKCSACNKELPKEIFIEFNKLNRSDGQIDSHAETILKFMDKFHRNCVVDLNKDKSIYITKK